MNGSTARSSDPVQQDDLYLLITRYLARQTSSAENEWLATWVAASAENGGTFDQLKAIWQHTQTLPAQTETTAARQRVKVRLALPEAPALRPISRWQKTKSYALVTLVLLVLLAVSGGWYFYPTAATAYQICRTTTGQQQRLLLADSSVVMLAPKSQLRYPTQFSGTFRDVYLEGEAFFEVKRDTGQPFQVHSGTWTTRVLGTKFNVNAFRGATRMAVSLVEGQVEVTDAQGTYRLTPGQQLLTDRRTGRVYRQPFDKSRVTGWQQRKLVFQNEKLADVAGQIERLYGVKLAFADTATAELRLWATFNNEPLPAVLNALKLAGPLTYRREGQVIYLQRQ